jgi:hypothetical protein
VLIIVSDHLIWSDWIFFLGRNFPTCLCKCTDGGFSGSVQEASPPPLKHPASAWNLDSVKSYYSIDTYPDLLNDTEWFPYTIHRLHTTLNHFSPCSWSGVSLLKSLKLNPKRFLTLRFRDRNIVYISCSPHAIYPCPFEITASLNFHVCLVISGYDLIEWLMERLNIEESGKKIAVCLKCSLYFYKHLIHNSRKIWLSYKFSIQKVLGPTLTGSTNLENKPIK